MQKRKRINSLYLTYAIFFTAIGLIMLFIKTDLIEYLSLPPLSVITFSVLTFLTGLSFFIMLYVRGDLFQSFNRSNNDLSNIDIIEEINNRIQIVEKEIERNKLIDKSSIISSDETRNLLNEKINSITDDEIIGRLNEKTKENLLNQSRLNIIDKELITTKLRIEKEALRTSRYGLINLMIGFITTFMAIYFLGYSLLGVQTNGLSTQDYIYHIIPRISLSILIEVFSFFFLRLYKKNLEDIKYLNNERTNIEMKIIAIKTGFLNDDKETLKQLIIKLADTERNFILKKDESTVEIEKNKLEVNNNNNFIAGILKIIDRK